MIVRINCNHIITFLLLKKTKGNLTITKQIIETVFCFSYSMFKEVSKKKKKRLDKSLSAKQFFPPLYSLIFTQKTLSSNSLWNRAFYFFKYCCYHLTNLCESGSSNVIVQFNILSDDETILFL